MMLLGAVDDAHHDFVGLGTPAFAEHAIDGVLMWLWDAVVEPIVDALEFTCKPRADAELPSICWCPSGFLSLMPLHAAGYHRTRADDAPRTLMDRAISTYTPTLKALLAPANASEPNPFEFVVVAMPSTPGAHDLPGAAAEARFLHDFFGKGARVLGAVDGRPPARREDVLNALPSSRWIHFACHALTEPKRPSSSGLLLHDGRDHLLSVRDLMGMDPDPALVCIKFNHCAGVRGPNKGIKKAKQYLFPAEFLQQMACKAIDLEDRQRDAVAVYTYMSKSEMKALEADAVNLDRRIIHVHQTLGKDGQVKELKGRYARRIPIDPEIVPVFRAVLARHPKGRPFNFQGRKAADKLRLHLKLAGVTREELFISSKTRKNITWHDLRATGITWAAMRGDDLAKIMQRAAHQNFETTRDYLREAENLRDADFGVPFPPLPPELYQVSEHFTVVSEDPNGSLE